MLGIHELTWVMCDCTLLQSYGIFKPRLVGSFPIQIPEIYFRQGGDFLIHIRFLRFCRHPQTSISVRCRPPDRQPMGGHCTPSQRRSSWFPAAQHGDCSGPFFFAFPLPSTLPFTRADATLEPSLAVGTCCRSAGI